MPFHKMLRKVKVGANLINEFTVIKSVQLIKMLSFFRKRKVRLNYLDNKQSMIIYVYDLYYKRMLFLERSYG